MRSIGCQPCLKYIIKGFCYPNCHFKVTHCTPVREDEKKVNKFIRDFAENDISDKNLAVTCLLLESLQIKTHTFQIPKTVKITIQSKTTFY